MKKLLLLLPFILLVGCSDYKCIKTDTVEEIVAVKHNTIAVRFESGIIRIYRAPANLRPGQELCIEKEEIKES